MRTYSAELKENLVAKMLPPHNVGVPQLVRETGIPRDTLYGWRRQAAGKGGARQPQRLPLGSWNSAEKFAAVVETASLNELELGEYCRRKGLFPEQIAAWRETCREANAPWRARLSGPSGGPSGAAPAPEPGAAAQGPRPGRSGGLAGTPKKSPGDLGGARGRSLTQERRIAVSDGIAQACAAGARLGRACAVAGLTARTLQRWRQEGALKADGRRREHRPQGTQRTPANRLSDRERGAILAAPTRHSSPT